MKSWLAVPLVLLMLSPVWVDFDDPEPGLDGPRHAEGGIGIPERAVAEGGIGIPERAVAEGGIGIPERAVAVQEGGIGIPEMG